MSDVKAPATLLVRAIRDASRGIARDLGEIENLQAAPASAAAFAEAGRERARSALRESLMAVAPAYGWSDDREDTPGRDPRRRWVVNPLSGIDCFRHGAPGAALMAAYQEREVTQSVAVLDPATGELFTARLGEGAWLERRRLRVSARADLSDCLVGASGAFAEDRAKIEAGGAVLRSAGSPALDIAWVAAGRLDAAAMRGSWTVAAAASALAHEAGARIRRIDAEDSERTLTLVAAHGVADAFAALFGG